MTINIEIVPILSIVAGAAILIAPRLLNYIVAVYLIFTGIVQMIS